MALANHLWGTPRAVIVAYAAAMLAAYVAHAGLSYIAILRRIAERRSPAHD
jgi:hypothetical protein